MERSSEIALLLAITMLFWIWQSLQTVFDESLPFLDISNGGFYSFRDAVTENQQLNSSSVIISVSEIVALCLGVATMASLYVLYLACSDDKATCLQNLMFTGLVSITSAGYGMHVVCVIVQLQLSKNNQLESLLDFVHERWSHNMFQFGIFSLLLLVIWAEKPESVPQQASTSTRQEELKFHRNLSTKSKLTLASTSTRQERPGFPSLNPNTKSIPTLLASPSINCNTSHTVIKSKELSALTRLWLKRLGPVIAGLFTAIFANRTGTGGAVLAFYISILVYNHKYTVAYDNVSYINQYVVLEFFVTTTLVGLPTLFVHGWLM